MLETVCQIQPLFHLGFYITFLHLIWNHLKATEALCPPPSQDGASSLSAHVKLVFWKQQREQPSLELDADRSRGKRLYGRAAITSPWNDVRWTTARVFSFCPHTLQTQSSNLIGSDVLNDKLKSQFVHHLRTRTYIKAVFTIISVISYLNYILGSVPYSLIHS